ncbi:glycosyltransferase family 2 protein [Riemerella anatipestifer]|uniref:glycosyltransferase family 2 protein n=1 Tax=Riemerella anatipestifer TaxID=34085 RepID=UPI001374D4E7|nr:glycosyltransferase family 2 protein [Riemerella anatipestifer]
MKTSLIISTYNWPEALALVLESVQQQSELPDEVLVADDGSGRDTLALVEKWQAKLKVPLIHIWHEDKGFRLSEIRNRAIAEAKYEYIIQIDGDVILHPDFVKDHKKFAEKNCFITGSRALLLEEKTQEVFKTKSIDLGFFTKGIKNRFNALRFPLFNKLSKSQNSPMEKMTTRIRGCNMSFWKEDLLAINGYDEDFVGWGREDSDIVIRLIKKGCFRKKIKLAAIQYHLYHKENSKNNLEANHKLMERALSDASFWAKNGIKK